MSIIQNHQFGHRSDLLVCLQRECSCLLDTLELLYADKISLSCSEVRELYASLRYGGVSSRQLNAAIKKVCSRPEDAGESGIRKDELALILPELDRRYFIVQGAQWEFQFLDCHWKGEISEKDALFLFKAVHGNRFVMHSWETFLHGRAERSGSKVTWEEIEVPLCDIPDDQGKLNNCIIIVLLLRYYDDEYSMYSTKLRGTVNIWWLGCINSVTKSTCKLHPIIIH